MLLWTRRQFIDAKLAKNYLLGVSLLAYSRLAVIDLKELKNNMRGMWYKDTWVAASGKNSMRHDRQYFVDTPPVIDDDSIKLPKLDENTADHVRNGLISAPQPVVENYELASITLEYRRECMKDSVLQSLTSS
ncbi:hypothetical protein QVD17_16691 [Tagetes erecta]|uniref:Uncharacterized protein n=1 Tax=Tagetes erecta TaxID=13708 RepID=A0AAD8KRZ7_TARER|nr:hypothetical protein QVD17_16691 [Tagetes erecta]